jgi:hypothetical protein
MNDLTKQFKRSVHTPTALEIAWLMVNDGLGQDAFLCDNDQLWDEVQVQLGLPAETRDEQVIRVSKIPGLVEAGREAISLIGWVTVKDEYGEELRPIHRHTDQVYIGLSQDLWSIELHPWMDGDMLMRSLVERQVLKPSRLLQMGFTWDNGSMMGERVPRDERPPGPPSTEELRKIIPATIPELSAEELQAGGYDPKVFNRRRQEAHRMVICLMDAGPSGMLIQDLAVAMGVGYEEVLSIAYALVHPSSGVDVRVTTAWLGGPLSDRLFLYGRR